MSEDKTAEKQDARSFEERVFARFDALDSSIRSVDQRLNSVETRLDNIEAKRYDTKPIWENAIKELADTRKEMTSHFGTLQRSVGNIERKLDVINKDILQMRADISGCEERLDKVEGMNSGIIFSPDFDS